jgi:DNA-binding transcriptional regulator YiaG
MRLRFPKATHSAKSPKWNKVRIRALREHMNATQAQFADELGIRQQTVSEWEVGAYIPTRAMQKALDGIAEKAKFKG